MRGAAPRRDTVAVGIYAISRTGGLDPESKTMHAALPADTVDVGLLSKRVEAAALAEALEVVLDLAHRGDPRAPGAAQRWHARYVREVPSVDSAEAQAVLGLLGMLSGHRWEQASRALAGLLAGSSRVLHRAPAPGSCPARPPWPNPGLEVSERSRATKRVASPGGSEARFAQHVRLRSSSSVHPRAPHPR